MAYKKYKTYKKAEEAVRKLGGKDKYFILKPGVDESFQVAPRKDFKPDKKAEGGMMNKNLKPVDKKKNPGLAKLPTKVRNKMGYMKDGGMVLEIGLRPATKDEMKMAKKMKKPMKKAGGGMVRGTGAAITGKGFKGVF